MFVEDFPFGSLAICFPADPWLCAPPSRGVCLFRVVFFQCFWNDCLQLI